MFRSLPTILLLNTVNYLGHNLLNFKYIYQMYYCKFMLPAFSTDSVEICVTLNLPVLFYCPRLQGQTHPPLHVCHRTMGWVLTPNSLSR